MEKGGSGIKGKGARTWRVPMSPLWNIGSPVVI